EFRFDLKSASTRNAFVPRLWASRRITFLADQARQLGAGAGPTLASRPASDPRLKELTDEILRLSTEFGIMSEYTSFLATEGTDLSDWNRLSEGCGAELQNRAVQMRCGVPAVTQSLNYNERKIRTRVDYRNEFWNENLDRVEVSTVQQVCDRAFF